MSKELIRLRDLCMAFDDELVLDHINLYINDSEFLTLLGPSGCGKTTITKKLVQRFGGDVSVIYHDNYYKAHHNMPYEERAKLNYDHPDSFDTDILIEDLKQLRAGHSIKCPVYDYSIHDRTDRTITVRPARVIIVEGILIFQSTYSFPGAGTNGSDGNCISLS